MSYEVYREQRRKWRRLFPTVAETLLQIKGRGSIIVGYTESMAFYSNYRIRRLGLDGVLDYVFCPKDHLLPSGLSHDDLRKYPAEHYELHYTKQNFTPEGSKKRDTAVLNGIISDLGLKKSECVFVGDSLMKDVAMSLDCGVSDVWAKYGQAHKRPEYKLLQEVTHWTTEDVAREQKINERDDVKPTHVLGQSFSQILALFDFKDSHNRMSKSAIDGERRKEIIDVWKEVVEVQQHFNDVSMRIRGTFITILLALFAAMGFLLDKRFTIDAWNLHVQYATIVPLFGLVGTLLCPQAQTDCPGVCGCSQQSPRCSALQDPASARQSSGSLLQCSAPAPLPTRLIPRPPPVP
jgi:phosphoglycolate phosphatase-like HAD superfamily hydrolase